MHRVLHSKPWITEEDVVAVSDILRSGMLAQGERVRDFEKRFGSWVGAEEGGVAVANGSAAIVLALKAFNIGAEDEVVFPTYVCRSVFDSVMAVGATPVLCDVGAHWVVTESDVAKCLTGNTKALIIPHMYGIFAKVEEFRQFRLPIIEDCAQAIDGEGKHKIIGDVAVFSFHPTKCLTTGEGGMAVSANPDIVYTMRSLRDGIGNGWVRKVFSPMSDISAALGLCQLARYHESLDRRRTFASGYRKALGNIIHESLTYIDDIESMFFRFPLRIRGGLDYYQELFEQENISVRRGVDALLHRKANLPDSLFPTAVELYRTTVSLPIFPALTDDEYKHCVSSAIKIFNQHAVVN